MPLAALFYRLELNPRRAAAAMLLVLASPLYWFTAARPLSDLPGLAMALAAQAILAAAFIRQRGLGAMATAAGASRDNVANSDFLTTLAASGQLIVLGAFLAGFAAGMRSQSVWLTLSLLVLVIADRAGRGAAGAVLGGTITFAIGGLLWFVPMVIATGGPTEYLHALGSQASEDFSGVNMLYTSARPLYRLGMNLFETFVSPWVATPLAFAILAFAAMSWRVAAIAGDGPRAVGAVHHPAPAVPGERNDPLRAAAGSAGRLSRRPRVRCRAAVARADPRGGRGRLQPGRGRARADRLRADATTRCSRCSRTWTTRRGAPAGAPPVSIPRRPPARSLPILSSPCIAACLPSRGERGGGKGMRFPGPCCRRRSDTNGWSW